MGLRLRLTKRLKSFIGLNLKFDPAQRKETRQTVLTERIIDKTWNLGFKKKAGFTGLKLQERGGPQLKIISFQSSELGNYLSYRGIPQFWESKREVEK